MTITFINPSNAPKPAGNYSNVAVIPSRKKLLSISGQIGNDIDGNVVCGFEASKGGDGSMEFIDLRKVNSARYKPVCLYNQRDRHMKAIGNSQEHRIDVFQPI